MIREHFGKLPNIETSDILKSSMKLYNQERDWTCCIACLRTITSNIDYLGSEDIIINQYNFTPGPYYSKDIKERQLLLNYNVIYGCDIIEKTPELLCKLLKDYNIMIETMLNYDHWLVILGYFTNNSTQINKHQILLYDPYFNKVRLENAEEIFSMWVSGEHIKNNIKNDFIAVRGRTV